MSVFYTGNQSILYILIEGAYFPIGCLTDDSFSEDVDMIETTTQDNEGWKTSRPTNQSYNIDFNGILTVSNRNTIIRYSYDLLVGLKRSRTLIDWKIELIGDDATQTQTGQGYLTSISNSTQINDYISFSGVIQGYGKPTLTSQRDEGSYLLWENGDNAITENEIQILA